MLQTFHFSDFQPSDELRDEANQALQLILDLAPSGAIALARLKKERDTYHCAVDVYSKLGPFMARTQHPSPLLAIHHCKRILSGKLMRSWKSRLEGSREIVIDKSNTETVTA